MYAVIGRVKIKPGQEQESLAMIEQGGVAMVNGFPGSRGGYWARSLDGQDLIQHSFWLFEEEEGARARRRRTRPCERCPMRLRRS
jgi:hypothetical protein